jgi:hypothetical protein
MTIFSSVGTTVSVAIADPATYDAAGFAALSWAVCGQLTELPSFGHEAALATHTPLATGIVNKRRGSVNYGSIALNMAVSALDSGQAILKTAGEANPGVDSSVSVRVALINGQVQYFTAQVMSFKTNVGGADAITMAEVQLEIENKIIKVG